MVCNHCGIAFSESVHIIGSAFETNRLWSYEFEQYDCPECTRSNIYLVTRYSTSIMNTGDEIGRRLVLPATANSQTLPLDIPERFRQDFSEASQVLDISPKASAALSRRLLEGILVENGAPASKNLFEQIEYAVSNGIPSYISNELDYIRQIGKFAAHAKSDRATGEIIDVEKEEAEAMLSIIDLLCDHYYVMPEKAKRRHQQLEEKLEASKAKPNEK